MVNLQTFSPWDSSHKEKVHLLSLVLVVTACFTWNICLKTTENQVPTWNSCFRSSNSSSSIPSSSWHTFSEKIPKQLFNSYLINSADQVALLSLPFHCLLDMRFLSGRPAWVGWTHKATCWRNHLYIKLFNIIVLVPSMSPVHLHQLPGWGCFLCQTFCVTLCPSQPCCWWQALWSTETATTLLIIKYK